VSLRVGSQRSAIGYQPRDAPERRVWIMGSEPGTVHSEAES